MKTTRLLLASVVLGAVLGNGCIITSAQVLTHFGLPNPVTIDSSNPADHSELIPVDLSTLSEYRDHKDELKGLTDVAILGKFTNVNGPAGGVLVYITPTLDSPAGGAPSVPAGATLLWGPGTIGPTGDSRTIGWDESAGLFNKAGKDLLISEVKGDGQFTLYTTGSTGTYNIRVDDGELVLVLDAGK
jgi:hypothetical protein